MAVYAYLVTPLYERPGDSGVETSRQLMHGYAERRGLQIDREFVEAPGDCYVAWEHNDWRSALLCRRPVGTELFAALRPGDQVIVDEPFLNLSQLSSLTDALEAQGVSLHIAQFDLRSELPPGKALAFCVSIEQKLRSVRTRDAMAEAKAIGRPHGGRPAPGWRHIGPPGSRRRVPDRDQREVMMCIVKLHLKDWGFRKISTFLAKQGIMHRVKNHTRREGYQLEFWSAGRCKRAYEVMLEILAGELAVKRTPTPQAD